MSYFTIPISAKTEKERDQRIADNKVRGFELVKKFEQETHKSWAHYGNRHGSESAYRYAGDDSRLIYCAIMRRDNTEYLERKMVAQ